MEHDPGAHGGEGPAQSAKPAALRKPGPGGWFFHPFELGISGFKGAGKTTLVETLIAHYAAAGVSTAFLKRDAHRFDMDSDGKDTRRAREAGAEVVSVEDRTHAAIIADHGPKGPLRAPVQQAVSGCDLVFVEGRKRSPLPKLVLLDPRGEIDELLARGEISNVRAVLYPSGDRERAEAVVPPGSDAPVVCRDDTERIVEIIDHFRAAHVAPVNGLLLLGGYSTRMGMDKAAIEYRPGVSAARHAFELLSNVCDTVYVSVRPGQEVPADLEDVVEGAAGVAGVEAAGTAGEGAGVDARRRDGSAGEEPSPDSGPVKPVRLEDRFLGFGPVGGILSALYENPRAAWLTLSCDLPLLREEDLTALVSERNPYKIATCVAVPGDPERDEPGELLPEPLCAVWEPRARERILSFLQEGATCPRWILRTGGARMVRPEHPDATFNANSPEELAVARRILRVNPDSQGSRS